MRQARRYPSGPAEVEDLVEMLLEPVDRRTGSRPRPAARAAGATRRQICVIADLSGEFVWDELPFRERLL